ncbi:MAG: cell division protein ZipA [Oceanospirillales bacterium]|nr:cell division protein ZipA [Oceanospirillales bacterium]
MDISLREWLIIGGVLIVILILVDGWRRVRANRNRLRLEIDRTLSELTEEEPKQSNPELPNGGARVRDREVPVATPPRVEPGFAEDRFAEAKETTSAFAEMDPLFDDIPAATAKPAPVAQARSEAESEPPIPVLLDSIGAAAERDAVTEDEPAVAERTRDETVDAEALEEPHHPMPPLSSVVTQESPAASDAWATETAAVMADVAEEASIQTQSEPAVAKVETGNRGFKRPPDPEQVLIITVVGRNGTHLPGPALHKIVTACGMEWGEMALYHRPEDNSADAPIQFSMANAVAPGTFDPANLEALETPAVTFFMSMAEPADAMTAYECMLATAEIVAKHLDGDLLDEDRSVMRPQTKEHYRERIRDFEMQQRQRRAT